MGAVYLAALVLGLGVLLLQFVMPGADADGAHGDFGDHGDPGADHGGHGGHGSSVHSDASAIAVFLSLRFWTFGLMAFGFVGTLLHFLGLALPLVTLVVASLVGVLSGLLASLTMRAISRAQTSSGGEADEAIGQIGRVLLAIEPGKFGKVRLEVHGRLLDFMATTDDERLEDGASVLVEELRGTALHVSRATGSLAPKPPESE